MVQRIIDDHGGTVDVKSKEGKGTIFLYQIACWKRKIGSLGKP